VTVSLKDKLDRCATEFSQLHEPVDSSTMILHMLKAFIQSVLAIGCDEPPRRMPRGNLVPRWNRPWAGQTVRDPRVTNSCNPVLEISHLALARFRTLEEICFIAIPTS
jgi:hypothetical protein